MNEHVLVDGHSPATIRYLGEVEGHQGQWIGVEWWNQTGKHNGTFQGHVYFQTKKPLGGSFIRPERIERGHSFTEAVERQYIRSFHSDYKQPEIDYSLFGKEYSDYRVELSSLLRIDLSCQWVDRFDSGEIYEHLRQIKELNLRQNLLQRWSQFWPIFGKYFSEVEILNLSNCRMLLDVSSPGEYPRVKQLVLIETNNDCPVFVDLLCSFPRLEDLYLDLNCLTDLSESFVDRCQFLRSLSLSDNPTLISWHPFVNRLGRLPLLEELFLNNCSITEIELDDEGIFPRLHSLYLSENGLHSFLSIDELSRVRSLRSLSILRNPLYPSDPLQAATAKQLIIARLPNLTHLNRVLVTRDERRGAEIDYLQRHAKEYFQPSTNFHLEHRNYRTLIEKYGEPNPPGDESIVKKGLVIKSSLFPIEFQLEGEKPVLKKIPASMTISKLKNFAKKLFPGRLTDRSIDLYFSLDDTHRQILADDYQDLHFYFDQQLQPATIEIHLL